MKLLKKLFKNYFLLSFVCIVFGVALIVNPKFFTNAISYTIAGISIGVGVVYFVRFFVKNSKEEQGESSGDFAMIFRGILLCALGIFLIVSPGFIFKVIAFVFGLYILLNGSIRLVDAMEFKKNDEDWIFSCVLAAVVILLGFVMVLNPMSTSNFAIRILGIALSVGGVINFILCITGNHKLKNLEKMLSGESDKKSGNKDSNDDGVIDVDYKDVD